MSIYDRTRNGKPVNPARALYNYWHSILVGAPPEHRNKAGRRTKHIDFNRWALAFRDEGPLDKPNIHFGYTFQITHKGDFRVILPFGAHQRDYLARNTFLRWGYFRGYNWYVDTTGESAAWQGRLLSDWQAPVPYVSEKVMKARAGYGVQPWLRLEYDGAEWNIKFSRPSESPRPLGSAEEFEWFEQLRQKRYAKTERDYKLAIGELVREERRVITQEEVEKRRNEVVQVLLAHMEVGSAARTVPLRKTTEEVGLWEPSGCP